MKGRPILVAVIGYIIGILWGLYFRFSIVPCYILIFVTYYIHRKFFRVHRKCEFKLVSFNRYRRYLNLWINRKVIIILVLLSSISNGIVLYQNNQYENTYQDEQKLEMIGVVVSQKTEKQYYDLYQIKLSNEKHLNLLIQVNKKMQRLEYGDKVKIQGVYKKPSGQRNYGGYDDEQYLKTRKIVGRVKVEKIEIVASRQLNGILQLANEVKEKIKGNIEERFEEEKSSILKGLLLGETTSIEQETREDFQISNISHVLAISGMHIAYIIIGIKILCQKVIGKRRTKIVTILVLIFYTFITGFSPSIVRAVVMGIIMIGGEIVYRKSDTWNSMAISLLGILIYNPFLILNVGLQLSYLGTIGMILFYSTILQIGKHKGDKKNLNVLEKIKEIIAVSLSAQIMILPILIYHFNIVGIYFLITNLFVSFIIGPIIILGFFSIINKIFVIPLNIGLEILKSISKFSDFPFAKIYLPTPKIINLILYFITLVLLNQMYHIYHSNHLTTTQKRVKNLIALFQYRFHQRKKKYTRYLLIIFLVIIVFSLFPKNLKIHFVDVGQGDCTFIVTPRNKTILIDGGGSLLEEFDVGKRTVIPYLLDRGYSSIDYIMISHFDQDHVGGILSVLEELTVKNIIISKQGEDSKQYQEFVKIVEQKNSKVIIVKKGDRVAIEKDIYFDILWPQDKLISQNILNNNAMVAKLQYRNFSMLLTGDIEQKAEELMLAEKPNLKADILKVAHHRL